MVGLICDLIRLLVAERKINRLDNHQKIITLSNDFRVNTASTIVNGILNVVIWADFESRSSDEAVYLARTSELFLA